MTTNLRRIGVLLSGRPGHREVALRQGEAIGQALQRLGHEVVPVFLDRELDLLVRQAAFDTAFVSMQGRYGEDGCLQGFLEILGIPHTGSGVLASSLSMNLVKTKEIFRLNNLPTAAGYVFDGSSGDELLEVHGKFGYPVTIRPVGDRGPLAEAIAYDDLELEACVEEALRLDDEVLIERHLPGRDVLVGMVDGEPMGAVELGRGKSPLASDQGGRSDQAGKGKGGKNGIDGKDGKDGNDRNDGRSASAACRLPAERYRSVLRLATLAYQTLGCEGPATVMIHVCDRSNEIVREVCTVPLLTPSAPLPRIARMAGMPYVDLVARILAGARLRAHGRKENRRQVQVDFSGPERRGATVGQAH